MKNLSLLVLGLILPLCLFSTAAYSNSVAELERIAAQAKTLEEFLGSTIVKEQYFNALKTYQHRDRFRCESFDKILAKVKTLSEKVPGFSKAIWEKTSATDIEVVAYRPIDDKKGSPFLPDKFMFRGTPRRFHALWNDPSLSGCYSDACNEDDTAMPDRWSVALQGSELYYVEKNGIFTDQSVLFLPLKRKDKDYRLIVIGGGPALLKEVDIWNGGRHKSFRQSLAQTLAQRLQKSRWKDNRQELLINKTERVLASTGAKVEGPIPVDEFAVPDALGTNVENVLPRKCLTGNLKSLAASLGKKSLSDETLQKFPVNSQLAPTFNDINAVSKMLADGSLAEKMPDASTLSDADKELVDSQLLKFFMDTGKDPNARARAGMALADFNRPNFSNAMSNRSSPYQPVSLNPKDTNANLAAAFAKSLHDPSAAVRAVASLGAIDSMRPIPEQAINHLEKSFDPSNAKKVAQASPDLLGNLVNAADRAGVFSPKIDENLDRPPRPKQTAIERLATATERDQFFRFGDVGEVLQDATRMSKNPDTRRRGTEILSKAFADAPPGGTRTAALTALKSDATPPAAKEMIEDALQGLLENCPLKARNKDFLKSKLPNKELSRWIRLLDELLIASAHATDTHAVTTSPYSEKAGDATTMWQCHSDGSDPTMISREISRLTGYYLNTTYDEQQKKWRSVPPGTPNSSCQWFLADEDASFKRGTIAPGSVLTGEFIGQQKGQRYMWVPPELVKDPETPKGWIPICAGKPEVGDYVSYVRGFINGERIPYSKKYDYDSLTALVDAKNGTRTLAESEKAEGEVRSKCGNSDELLSRSRCSAHTGDKNQPDYCTLGPKAEASARALGAQVCDRYPGLFESAAN